VHAKFGVQLRPSKQESAPNETGERCGNVRRTNPARPMAETGQTPTINLSRSMSASTSSRHYAEIGEGRCVPILLQKSFCTADQKF